MSNKFRLDDILNTYDEASWNAMYNEAGKVANPNIESYNTNYINPNSAENIAWNEMYETVTSGEISTLDSNTQQVLEKWNDIEAWNEEFDR